MFIPRFFFSFILIVSANAIGQEKQLPTSLHRFEEFSQDVKITILSKLIEGQSDEKQMMLAVLPFLKTSKKYYESREFFKAILGVIRGVFRTKDEASEHFFTSKMRIPDDLEVHNMIMSLLNSVCQNRIYLSGVKAASWCASRASKAVLREEFAKDGRQRAWASEHFFEIVREARIEQLQLLAAAGIDINYEVEKSIPMASHGCCQEDDPALSRIKNNALLQLVRCLPLCDDVYERMSFLLSWGADPNSVNENGHMVLAHLMGCTDKDLFAYHRVASALCLSTTKLLMRHGFSHTNAQQALRDAQKYDLHDTIAFLEQTLQKK